MIKKESDKPFNSTIRIVIIYFYCNKYKMKNNKLEIIFIVNYKV